MKTTILSFSIIASISMFSQTQQSFLDVNQVKARIFNSSDMHWDLFGSGNASYEVPIGSGKNSNFASGLWMGGIDQSGQLHIAAQTYRQNGVDFWPGPLDTITGNISSTVSSQYDKIWKLNKSDITAFITNFANGNVQNNSYTPVASILTWPAHGTGNLTRQMAPFVDVNHNGIYDPLVGGDYPEIKGDQMLYFIFNDNFGTHQATGGVKLGVEIHASIYAYGNSSFTSTYPFLNYTTFYNYKIINRSANNYNNMYLTMWTDADLGYYGDDYIGSDVQGNFGYIYNSSNFDMVYGSNPPAAGFQVLDGPIADANDNIDNDRDGVFDEPCENMLMTKLNYYNNSFAGVPLQTTDPQNAAQYYGYMTGHWRDNSNFTCGGNAYGGTAPTDFVYPSNTYPSSPCATTPWSETGPSGDRRFMLGSGPFTFYANTTREIEYAHCTSFSTINSVAQLKSDMHAIKTFYDIFTPSNQCNNVSVKENKSEIVTSIYPNPVKDKVNFTIHSKSKQASLQVYDMTGHLIRTIETSTTETVTINLENLVSGIYLIKISTDEQVLTKKIIKE